MIENLLELRRQLLKDNPNLQHIPISAFDFDSGDPRRMPRLSLEQQKKRAKDLLRSLNAGEASARTRAYDTGVIRRTGSSQDFQKNKDDFSLMQCQQIIAKELGFQKWTDLKHHIEVARIAEQAMASGEPTALDRGTPVLHIRCGSDIKQGLALAGFIGDFLEFADPYCQGPVVKTETLEEFLAIRSAFIAQSYHMEKILERMTGEYACLKMATNYDRVFLWLEHDSYDQLILAKCLAHFKDSAHRPQSFQLVSVEGFPGVHVFNGIGQLPPDALRVLWRDFREVTEEQYLIGQHTWNALREDSPEALLKISRSGTPALPTMSKAVARHLRELPSIHNGLSLVEELTLQILAEKGPMNAARLFGWYTNHYEPLPFLGDLQYWDSIHRLTSGKRPAVIINKSGDLPKDWHVELTDIGRALLAESLDWLTLTQSSRWVGGIKIDPESQTHWRIDRCAFQLSVSYC